MAETQSEIQAEVQDGGVLVRCNGENRFISGDEVREMCESDNPVTVK